MSFAGTGKIWMNGNAGGLGRRQDPRRLPRHPLRHGRLRGRALLRDTEAARPASASTITSSACWTPRKIYRMESPLDQEGWENGDPRHDPRQQVQGLLHPPADVSRLQPARRQPAAVPGGHGRAAVGMGRLPRRRRAREGRRRVRELVEPHGAEHVPGGGEGHGQLRQLGAHQDGGRARRLRRGHRARHAGLRQRRQRPEPVPRADERASTRRR